MRFHFFAALFFCVLSPLASQGKMDKALSKWNKQSVPYIHVDELKALTDVLLLDTRTHGEFEVSHLQKAHWVGHKEFKADSVAPLIDDKSRTIIVYCSIGVRSEDVGEKLLQAGYTNVKNLYGGIFEWKNRGYPIYGADGKETEKIHAFNRTWGKLLEKGEKVYNVPSDVRNR
ncbi:rhodanese-like domain-containing protein [Pseudozobellia thermophila]|uniref:Rhodanese-related sulfurtransferase n=1 Tax=Pseudozobellia thermophila TaxID=192903 RepID=A0A1M6D334_9FLAO|nr:rhodanese-like domain-containing protein [Pseudozobellia thermophila]SHI67650.1 Rhodanese-related sulfurtransferase [Pseudozobellia thermophila]